MHCKAIALVMFSRQNTDYLVVEWECMEKQACYILCFHCKALRALRKGLVLKCNKVHAYMLFLMHNVLHAQRS